MCKYMSTGLRILLAAGGNQRTVAVQCPLDILKLEWTLNAKTLVQLSRLKTGCFEPAPKYCQHFKPSWAAQN